MAWGQVVFEAKAPDAIYQCCYASFLCYLCLRQMLILTKLLQSLRKINHKQHTPLLIVYTFVRFI